MKHALSIDLEDWFCAYSLRGAVPAAAWDRQPLRVERSAEALLQLLERRKTRATFFVLGWVAQRVPGLIARLERAGHEIATHGYSHRLLGELTPETFEQDLRLSLDALRGCIRQPIRGFRAPSFSLTPSTMWAVDVLKRNGIVYDSSVFPMGLHPDCGDASAGLAPYRHANGLREVPLTCVEFLGARIPCCGGTYFRVMPYWLTRRLILRRESLGLPVVFYFHPWEADPEHPRVGRPSLRTALHYWNLGIAQARLDRLLGDFEFGPIDEVFEIDGSEAAACSPAAGRDRCAGSSGSL